MSAENERLNHLLSLPRYAEAERYARECIGKLPDWGVAYTQLARALAGLGRHPEAVEAAREGVRKSPRDAWALAILGYALKHAGRLADAADALRDAARTDPTYTWTYCMLAEVELDRNRPKDAYEATLAGVRHDPNAENLLRWKAWCEYQLDKLDAAVATAESGLSRHPNSPLLRNVVGCVRWHQAERTSWPRRKVRLHAAAHEYLAEAVRLNPSEAVYRNNMTRNARVCREYVLNRMLAVLMAVPVAVTVVGILMAGRFPPLPVPALIAGLALSMAVVIHFASHEDVTRAAPLGWLGVPTPPLGEDERRRGRRRMRRFAAAYLIWLILLAGVWLAAGWVG